VQGSFAKILPLDKLGVGLRIAAKRYTPFFVLVIVIDGDIRWSLKNQLNKN
jgi:hypothetical protein